jgi:hypothetical protein
MPLLQLVVLLIVIGVLVWLMNTYIPMDATIKRIINILIIVVVVLWLLSIFGLFDNLSSVRVPRIGGR